MNKEDKINKTEYRSKTAPPQHLTTGNTEIVIATQSLLKSIFERMYGIYDVLYNLYVIITTIIRLLKEINTLVKQSSNPQNKCV